MPAALEAPEFRLDNEELAFRFTATLSDRHGQPVERLPTPARLDDWLLANRISVADVSASEEELALAHRLRAAIHDVGTASVTGEVLPAQQLAVINQAARDCRARPLLDTGGMQWASESDQPVRDSLGIIAIAAITVLGAPRGGAIKTCQDPDCHGLYLDTSQAQRRRWCSMNTCGNRAKKKKFRSKHKP